MYVAGVVPLKNMCKAKVDNKLNKLERLVDKAHVGVKNQIAKLEEKLKEVDTNHLPKIERLWNKFKAEADTKISELPGSVFRRASSINLRK